MNKQETERESRYYYTKGGFDGTGRTSTLLLSLLFVLTNKKKEEVVWNVAACRADWSKRLDSFGVLRRTHLV